MAKKKETKAQVFIVEAPVKDFCGVGAAGIHFAYGKAEVCEGHVLDWYRKKGYKVTPKEDAETEAEKSEDQAEK